MSYFGKKTVLSSVRAGISELWPELASSSKVHSWNAEFETTYWDNNHKSNPKELCGKLLALNYFKNIQILDAVPTKIADVGGGVNGGVLQLFNAENKDLFDPLKPNLRDISSHAYLASEIPPHFSNYDVIFCFEALDHCSDMNDFILSLNRICSMVRDGGLLFFEMPIRKLPVNGHPISLKDYSRRGIKNLIMKAGFNIVDGYNFGPNFNSPRSFGIVAHKVKYRSI